MILARKYSSRQHRFDQTYISMAESWSQLSHANRKKVGALIVKDNSIISDGYNGTPAGFENECEEAINNEDGSFKEKHDTFAIGRSLLMSPFSQFFTWQTTPITEIVGAEADLSYLKFKTENSCYTLTKNKHKK